MSAAQGRLSGALFILASATAFGVMPIFARYAYAAGADTSAMLLLRFGIAGLLMAAVMAGRGASWPRGRILLGLVLMGGIGYAGQSFAYFSALRYASAGLVALLLYAYPLLVALWAMLFLKERLTRGKIMALLVATVGLVLTIGPAVNGRPIGVVLGLSAALIYSVYIVAGSRITPYAGALGASTVVMLAAALTFAAGAALGNPHWPATLAGWAAVAAIALISTVLAILAFFAGLNRLGASEASMLSTFEPVVSVVSAAWLLDESMSASQWLGGGLILAAALLLAATGKPASPAPKS
ncbi:DMT family transporter [Chitinivorax sp. PXF-14]|uniref:DMT family transporter n=1 Tax=Chitinivorax sp. PXF-14 TaxID=3230488 RepID=UPI003466F7F1